MEKKHLAVVILGILFLTTGIVCAQESGESRGEGKWQKEEVFKELNLTPEQQQKLQENRKGQREQRESLFSSMKEKRTKLQEELNKPEVTRASIEPLVSEIKALQGQMIDQRISGIFTVKAILTPEQFAKFQELMGKSQNRKKSGKWGN